MSQPVKLSSPGSLASSQNSDKTQRPLDRTRTVSLTGRGATGLSSKLSPNGVRGTEQSRHSTSPSAQPLSRSSSQSSFHRSDSPDAQEQPHAQKRNWNSSRPKWNAASSPSVSEKRRSDNAARMGTPPTDRSPVVPAPHGANSSPSSIPRLVANGRPRPKSYTEISKTSLSDNHRSKNTVPLSTISTNTPVNGEGKSSKDRYVKQPTVAKEHKAHARREQERASSHADSPTVPPEVNGTEESEEDGTPKLGQQQIPDSPTPVSGPRPGSHAGANKGKDRVKAVTASFRPEKDQYLKQTEGTQPLKLSMPAEPIDLHDSDLDSFQGKTLFHF